MTELKDDRVIPALGIARSQKVNKMSARVGKEWEWIQKRRLE
jgi:hypothetical protein